jgi:hypothetical protein
MRDARVERRTGAIETRGGEGMVERGSLLPWMWSGVDVAHGG